jgi:hypothetical protein
MSMGLYWERWNYPYLQCSLYDSYQRFCLLCIWFKTWCKNAVKEDSLTRLWHFRKTIRIVRQPWGLLRICGILTGSFLSIGFDRGRIQRNMNRRQTFEWFTYICPAVYSDGRVCISILHPPGDDPSGYELASERWTPVHTVCSNWFEFVHFCSLHSSRFYD